MSTQEIKYNPFREFTPFADFWELPEDEKQELIESNPDAENELYIYVPYEDGSRWFIPLSEIMKAEGSNFDGSFHVSNSFGYMVKISPDGDGFFLMPSDENPPEMECIIDANYGQYLPQRFKSLFGGLWETKEHNVKDNPQAILFWQPETDAERKEMVKALLDLGEGPDNPYYWESWEFILEQQYLTYDGQKVSLHQDSDLFMYPTGFSFEVIEALS